MSTARTRTVSLTGKPITKAQIKHIHVQLHRRGIDDATYRALLDELFGVTTCTALTRRQASALLNRLGVRLKAAPGERPPPVKPARPPRAPLPDGVVRLASPEQHRFIRELAAEIEWRVEDGLTRWLEHTMGLTRVRTVEDGQKVIEGLKALKHKQPLPAGDDGGPGGPGGGRRHCPRRLPRHRHTRVAGRGGRRL